MNPKHILTLFLLLNLNTAQAQFNNLLDALSRSLSPQGSAVLTTPDRAGVEISDGRNKVGIKDVWLGMSFEKFIENQLPKIGRGEYDRYQVKDGKIGKGREYAENFFHCYQNNETPITRDITICDQYQVDLFEVSATLTLVFYQNNLARIMLNGFPRNLNYGQKEFVYYLYTSLLRKFGDFSKIVYVARPGKLLSGERYEATKICANYLVATQQMAQDNANSYCDPCGGAGNPMIDSLLNNSNNKCGKSGAGFVDLRPYYDKYKSGPMADIISLSEIAKDKLDSSDQCEKRCDNPSTGPSAGADEGLIQVDSYLVLWNSISNENKNIALKFFKNKKSDYHFAVSLDIVDMDIRDQFQKKAEDLVKEFDNKTSPDLKGKRAKDF